MGAVVRLGNYRERGANVRWAAGPMDLPRAVAQIVGAQTRDCLACGELYEVRAEWWRESGLCPRCEADCRPLGTRVVP